MKSETLKIGKPMLSLLEQHGITTATPIQHEIIPAVREGRDVIAQSETGSGKTLAFAIPIIEKTSEKEGLVALVLVPTRELCLQVAGEFHKFSAGKHLGIAEVYGGVSIPNQVRKLHTANIVVATPGRLIDLLERKALSLDTIRTLVFDEADRMLDMGFIRDIERILRHIRQEHQTLLLSATISDDVAVLSRKYLRDPKRIQLASSVEPDFLHQTYYQTTSDQKLPLLIALLKQERELALIFCNRKHFASKIARRLSAQGVPARALHGDLSQAQRERVSGDFRQKKFNILVATDVAARGLHIEDISHVYNYEIPKDVESYTHRVGRTARAGKKGEAISLVAGPDEEKFFRQILFTYRGIISLKTLGDVPPLRDVVGEEGTRHRKRGTGGGNGGGGRSRDQQQRSRHQGAGGSGGGGGRDRRSPRGGAPKPGNREKRGGSPQSGRQQPAAPPPAVEESKKGQSKWRKAWKAWMNR